MTKPELVMTASYPAWDLQDLESRDRVHKLRETADRVARLKQHTGPGQPCGALCSSAASDARHLRRTQ